MMSGTNTYKEHLLYNEQELNYKNINIVFDPRQLFDPSRYFMEFGHPLHPHYLFYPRQNLMNPHQPRTYTTHIIYTI